jgi:hypothetical protein
VWVKFKQAAAAQIVGETGGECVEQQPDRRRRLQVLVHDLPHLEREARRAGQNGNEVGLTARDALPTAADSAADAQSRDLRQLVVAAQAERLARERPLGADRAKRAVVAVEADDAMTNDCGEAAPFRVPPARAA